MDKDNGFHSYGSPDVRGVVDSYLRLHGGIMNVMSGPPIGTMGLTESSLVNPVVSHPFCLIANSHLYILHSFSTASSLDQSTSSDKLIHRILPGTPQERHLIFQTRLIPKHILELHLIIVGAWYVHMLLRCQTLIEAPEPQHYESWRTWRSLAHRNFL